MMFSFHISAASGEVQEARRTPRRQTAPLILVGRDGAIPCFRLRPASARGRRPFIPARSKNSKWPYFFKCQTIFITKKKARDRWEKIYFLPFKLFFFPLSFLKERAQLCFFSNTAPGFQVLALRPHFMIKRQLNRYFLSRRAVNRC